MVTLQATVPIERQDGFWAESLRHAADLLIGVSFKVLRGRDHSGR